MPRKKAAPVVRLPGNFHAWADELGLNVITWLNIAVMCEDGVSRWLPRDLIGSDGKTLIVYRSKTDGVYSIDGWEPHHAGMNGGRYESFESALNWLKRAQDIKAGRAENFLGC